MGTSSRWGRFEVASPRVVVQGPRPGKTANVRFPDKSAGGSGLGNKDYSDKTILPRARERQPRTTPYKFRSLMHRGIDSSAHVLSGAAF